MARPTKATKLPAPGSPTPGMFIPSAPNEEPPEDEIEEQTEEEIAAEDAIQEANDESPRQPYAMIYVTRSDSPTEKYLDRTAVSNVSQQWLAKTYGGGAYRVQTFKPGKGRNGKGVKMVYDSQRKYDVDDSIPPRVPSWLRSREALEGPVEGGTGRRGDILDAGILQLFQAQATMMNNVANQTSSADKLLPILIEMAKPKAPAFDMVALLGALSPIIVAFVSSMSARKDPAELATQLMATMQRREETDPLEVIERVSNILGPKSGATNGANELLAMMDVFTRVREMAGGGDAGGSGTDMMSLVGSLGPKVLEMLTEAQRAEVARLATLQPRTQQAAPPQLSAPSAAQQTGDETNVPFWRMMLRQYAPRVVELATAGKNPALYAEVTIDNIPAQFKGVFEEAVRSDTFVTDASEELAKAAPELVNYSAWVAEFLTEIQNVVLGVEDDTDDDDGGADAADDDSDETDAAAAGGQPE